VCDIYTYAATIVRIIDADSIVVDLDMGRHIWVRDAKHRLNGCNAREHTEPGGPEARDNLAALLPVGAVVTLKSLKPYKYGDEYMADITLPDGRDLVPLLIADGWAVGWSGLGPKPVPPWPRLVAA
jgi:endonuclease YncB( thermonuclease family)